MRSFPKRRADSAAPFLLTAYDISIQKLKGIIRLLPFASQHLFAVIREVHGTAKKHEQYWPSKAFAS